MFFRNFEIFSIVNVNSIHVITLNIFVYNYFCFRTFSIMYMMGFNVRMSYFTENSIKYMLGVPRYVIIIPQCSLLYCVLTRIYVNINIKKGRLSLCTI